MVQEVCVRTLVPAIELGSSSIIAAHVLQCVTDVHLSGQNHSLQMVSSCLINWTSPDSYTILRVACPLLILNNDPC